jgi:hypothetical protein
MKKLLALLALVVALVGIGTAQAQTYPSPTVQNLTVLGTPQMSGLASGTCASGLVLDSGGDVRTGSCPGSGGSVSITAGNAGIVFSPSPLTGTGTASLNITGGGASSNEWVNSISTAGVATLSQPAFSNLTGSASAAQMSTNLGAAVSTLCSASTTNFVRGDGTCVTPGGGGNVSTSGSISTGAFGIWASGTGLAGTVVPGTGVTTALGDNVGIAGAFVVNGGVLGTPSSGTLTNATGLPAAGVLAGAPANGMTATTQATSDNTTKVATDAFVIANGGGTPVSFTGTTTGSANTYLLTTVPSSGFVLSNQPVIEAAFNAANTGASTINVDSTGAVAIDVQTPLGLSALVGGEIAAGNTMRTLQYNSAASVYVLKNQLGAPVSDPCTSQTITAAQWAAGFTCTITAASQTLTFPAVTTLSPQGGVFINSVGQYFTVTPAAADGINAGAVNTSATFGPGSYSAMSSGTSGGTASTGLQVAGGARAIPVAISWLPGQNLAAAALPIANLKNTNGWMISQITCTPEVVAGGTATIDLWEAPSETALGSGTKLTTTPCNANTGAGTDQALLSSPVAVPAGDRIGVIATGAGFTSSPLGAGVLTATLQQ